MDQASSPTSATAGSTGACRSSGQTSAVAAAKMALRADLRERRRHFTVAHGAAASQAVCANLAALPAVQQAGCLAVYAALPGEVDLRPLVARAELADKMLLLPRFNAGRQAYDMVAVERLDAGLVPGNHGVLEPAQDRDAAAPHVVSQRTVTWLVPGTAFDAAGRRLGRGRGYYDRLLTGTTGVRIGVAFDWQIVAGVPAAAHDATMDLVVTESRVLSCSGDRALQKSPRTEDSVGNCPDTTEGV